MASPKQSLPNNKNSIDKINKGINDSIKQSHKEFQLMQAYQQQKWKEQIQKHKVRPSINVLLATRNK